MTSQVDLCNMSLSHVHAGTTIQAIDEDTTESNACLTYYDMILRSMQRDHPFNFGNSYRTLALDGTAPSPWLYRYAYPTDCIRCLEIVDPAKGATPIKYDVYQEDGTKFIVTNQPDAVLKYSAFISDPNRFDASFISAFTWILAYHIAGTITGSKSVKQDALTIATNMWASATANDANEGEADVDETPEWITARTGSSADNTIRVVST